MIISINAGHTLSGYGSGAVGLINESEETRIIADKVITLLKKQGHTVYNHTVDSASSNTQYLQRVVDMCNNSDAELFLSIHLNASDNPTAKGTEVFTYEGCEIPEAVNIVNNLGDLGFKNRCLKTDGTTEIKDGSHLFVIRKTRQKALLIEVCFCTNKEDVNIYKNNLDKVAEAIASGITGKAIESDKTYLNEFEEAKKQMMSLGITDGSRPKDNVTREELWTMLHRFYNSLS